MEENNTPQENDTPRPKWQIWGARVLLVLVIIGLVRRREDDYEER